MATPCQFLLHEPVRCEGDEERHEEVEEGHGEEETDEVSTGRRVEEWESALRNGQPPLYQSQRWGTTPIR